MDLCDSSAMATDIAEMMENADPIGFTHVGEILACDDGHAFEVLTDSGRAFQVTITEISPSA